MYTAIQNTHEQVFNLKCVCVCDVDDIIMTSLYILTTSLLSPVISIGTLSTEGSVFRGAEGK